MTFTTVKIDGYQTFETIHEGLKSVVFKAQRLSDNKCVILKLLRSEYPSFNELIKFRHQYIITQNLDLPGIVKPLALEKYRNSLILVMPDEGYISLADYLQNHALSLTQCLKIGIKLTDILQGLYYNRIIHKDIKPANILIHPNLFDIQLIDFSIASLLPKETQIIQNPNILEGTLAYISPEQTGRMNRGIDYRTDFYSLGITLYELITGKLPFETTDAMELVHCHIAKIPTFPHTKSPQGSDPHRPWGAGVETLHVTSLQESGESGATPVIKNHPEPAPSGDGGNAHQGRSHETENIPNTLTEIVMKLMAKNAEDRYQSAWGIQKDLENCLNQLENTGKIELFKIGKQDICDGFNIPEKLYGRETEVQILLDAFERVSRYSPEKYNKQQSELMLVAGYSGVGKTAVVNEVHKPIVKQRGYFIKGKFDQFNRNIPFSAFVQALRNLMSQLLSENDSQLQQWKNQILGAVGENGQVILEVIPELKYIIGEQPAVAELSGTAAQNRFNLLFQKFLQVFTIKEHPLVIFLDDLQWADSASLNLIKLLMSEANQGYLLLIGAYRDNEVNPAHPLMLTLDEIDKQNVIINTITLAPLQPKYLNQLIADTLRCSLKQALPLTQAVDQKTKGNPFFATQFLKALYEDELIHFNPEEGFWQCDLAKVKLAAVSEGVVEFVGKRLQKLNPLTQDALKLAACIGNEFDLETLAIVRQTSELKTATDLWQALKEGLILPTTEVYKFYTDNTKEINLVNESQISARYKFLHDRIQQAAYSLIPEDKKKQTHLKIGELLLSCFSKNKQEERIFELVNQLNLGIKLISEPAKLKELAYLNHIAARKAKFSTAYAVAGEYLSIAIELLKNSPWEKHYHLTLTLYLELAEIEYINTHFEESQALIEEITKQAKNILDRLKADEIKIQMQTAKNQLEAAIETGLNNLNLLEIELFESASTDFNMRDLYHLPEMKDPRMLAALRILIKIAAPAYNAKPQLIPLIAVTMVDICRRNGNSSLAAYGYAFYGMILCSALDNIPLGYQFGCLALEVLERFPNQSLKGEVHHLFNVGIRHWQEPALSTLEAWKQTIQFNQDSGNIGYVCYAAMGYCINLFLTGQNLDVVDKNSKIYLELIQNEKQDFPFFGTVVWIQFVQLLKQPQFNDLSLSGDLFNEVREIPRLKESQNLQTLFSTYLIKGIFCYLFGNYQDAVNHFNSAQNYQQTMAGLLAITQYPFYQALTLLALYPTQITTEKEKFISVVDKCQNLLNKWAENAPMNYQHKVDLVEAEKCRVLNQKLEAIELYDKAIAGAKENKYIQEEALANELAAKFYLEWGKEKIAQTYMIEAYYCYSHWGAKAKVQDLENRYPQLLSPILEQQKISLNPFKTIASLGTTSSHSQATISSHTTRISDALDFTSVIKASFALSSEIELNQLISQLMQVMIENAGATKAVLILSQDSQLIVEAIYTHNSDDEEQTTIIQQSIPVEESLAVPLSIINSVKRSLKPLNLEQVSSQTHLASDSYCLQQQPQSLLCLPLKNRGKFLGILYLENNLTIGAFTDERIEVLKLLCSQAAISLENAKLYQKSQDYAKQLEQSLKDLQEAQVQLVQSEKMSALGEMMAGIAHEINNPVGFIGGNITHAEEYLSDLIEHLNLYQDYCLDAHPEIAEHAESIDLDYLLEDLPDLISSMKTGVDRIRNISKSMRTFSRSDTDKKVEFNLEDGIESTLLILKHRLKASENRAEINLIKNYSNLPQIWGYPGQLNQVFMNLIANAIDVLDERKNLQLSSDHSPQNWGVRGAKNIDHPQIMITTELIADQKQIMIKIKDNGLGMTEEVQQKIFEHLFTTKPVGKGTGLGLSISRQIIEDKHNGILKCNSQLGKGTEFIIFLPL